MSTEPREQRDWSPCTVLSVLSRSVAAVAAAEELSKRLQETQEMKERLRESHSECNSLKEEKVRLEVVVRMLEAEVKEVSDNEFEFDSLLGHSESFII